MAEKKKQTHMEQYLNKNMSREELLMDRMYFSFNPLDVNYITPEQHALLLEVVDFLTPANVQKYFVDFYMKKIPCCGRTLYVYLTKILNDPALAHLAHYRHKGKTIHVLEFYKQAMSSERRRNNDVFGRSVLVQVRLSKSEWVPVKVCQIMLCYMIDRMHLFEHIKPFLGTIAKVMEHTEQTKLSNKFQKANLAKKDMITTDTVDFHLTDHDGWKIRFDQESKHQKTEIKHGIDFYMT